MTKENKSKYNKTTGKKFAVGGNYAGINTPYFSAGDYTARKQITTGNPRAFFAKGLKITKEKSILEYLGKKITLEVRELTTYVCPVTEIRADGQPEETEEEKPFFKMAFPGGNRTYSFKINSILIDTFIANGLLEAKTAGDDTDPVETADYTYEELKALEGKKVSGYFYYTMENGGGKKLFQDAETCEAYHNAIQARWEDENIKPESETQPGEMEK